jgi:hypothetical protein
MNTDVPFRVDDHSKNGIIPKLCNVVYVDGRFVLSDYESRRCTAVVNHE